MKNFLLLSAIYLFTPQLAAAEDFEELRRNLTEKMPQVTIGEIRKLPYVDLYEIQCNGVNVFYTDAKGEVALFGNLMELPTSPTGRTAQGRTDGRPLLPASAGQDHRKGNAQRDMQARRILGCMSLLD